MPSASGIKVTVKLVTEQQSAATLRASKMCSEDSKTEDSTCSSFQGTKCREFSTIRSTQVLDKDVSVRVHDTYIPVEEESIYAISLRLRSRPFTDFGCNVIIDGVDQGSWILRKHIFPHWNEVNSRRITSTTYRCFKFQALIVDDEALDYFFDEKAHATNGYIHNIKDDEALEAVNFMVGKNAVGTIRVNVFRIIGKVGKVGDFHGAGDYEVCEKVDEIGQMKIGGIETITALTPPKTMAPKKGVAAKLDKFPFESFVFHYKTRHQLAAQNLLIPNKSLLASFFGSIASIFKPSAYKKVKAAKSPFSEYSEKA